MISLPQVKHIINKGGIKIAINTITKKKVTEIKKSKASIVPLCFML